MLRPYDENVPNPTHVLNLEHSFYILDKTETLTDLCLDIRLVNPPSGSHLECLLADRACPIARQEVIPQAEN